MNGLKISINSNNQSLQSSVDLYRRLTDTSDITSVEEFRKIEFAKSEHEDDLRYYKEYLAEHGDIENPDELPDWETPLEIEDTPEDSGEEEVETNSNALDFMSKVKNMMRQKALQKQEEEEDCEEDSWGYDEEEEPEEDLGEDDFDWG